MKKILVTAGVASIALVASACGSSPVETQAVSQPAPVTQAEPAEKDAGLGFDPEAIASSMQVCMDASDAMLDANQAAQDTGDIALYYSVIADESTTCLNALALAGDTITDPELAILWDDHMDANAELIAWTDAGWTGTIDDLEGTTDRMEAVSDTLGSIAEWFSGHSPII